MVTRVRLQYVTESPAGASRLRGWADLEDHFSSVTSTNKCTDVVDGTRNNHPLFIEHYSPALFWVYGNSHNIPEAPGYHWEYNGRPFTWVPNIAAPTTTPPSNNRALSTGLARTNPNRPNVDVLQFVGELRDLPKMVKGIGDTWMKLNSREAIKPRNIPKEIASGTLAVEFGWLPFVKDLMGLLDFQSNVDKKLKMLDNLRSGGSSGGTAVVWEDWADTPPGPHFISNLWNESNKVSLSWESSYKKWVSCTWKPSVPLPPKTDAGDRNLAMRLAYGTDISLAVMWELMPWSWLIDWFSNVGDLASLSRNTIPVSNQGSCVMLKSESKVNYHGPVPGAGTGKYQLVFPRRAPYSTKERWVMDDQVPLPEFNLPFLNGKQLGILTSLAIAKNGTVRIK